MSARQMTVLNLLLCRLDGPKFLFGIVLDS
jgi:hypothetical protein